MKLISYIVRVLMPQYSSFQKVFEFLIPKIVTGKRNNFPKYGCCCIKMFMRCFFELVPGLYTLLTFSDLEITCSYTKYVNSIWDFIAMHPWVWMAWVVFFVKSIKEIISDKQFRSTAHFFLLCGKAQTLQNSCFFLFCREFQSMFKSSISAQFYLFLDSTLQQNILLTLSSTNKTLFLVFLILPVVSCLAQKTGKRFQTRCS